MELMYGPCRLCGKKIAFVRNIKTGRWISCEPRLYRFTPSGGPDTYVDAEGKTVRGKRDRNGSAIGHLKHRRSCERCESETNC